MTANLFSSIAAELATGLNYDYPVDLEENILEYLKKIKRLEKNATHF